jgi:hypothetical protein
MTERRRNPIWILGLAAALACAIVVSLVAFLRGAAPPSTVQAPIAHDAGSAPREIAPAPSAPDERAGREIATTERSTISEPAAWSFEVVDRHGTPIEGAELSRGDRVLARSSSLGRVSVGARALDVENAPSGLAWSVRHPGHRTCALDASRIGRIDRVVLDDPWPLVVHVQDASGAPLAGAECVLYELRASDYPEIARTASTPDGSARFDDIVVAAALLRVRSPGFEPYERRLRANDESDREVTVALSKGVDLRVRVTDAHMKPVSGAHVRASYEILSASEPAPATWDEVTNGQGAAVLANFPRAGRTMQLYVAAKGFLPAFESIAMNESFAVAGVDVVLPSIGSLHVRVHEADATQRAAVLRVYYGHGGFGGHAADQAPVLPVPGGGVGEYNVLVRAGVDLRLVAEIDGSSVAACDGLSVQEGETREVDLVVAHHVPLDVHAAALDGECKLSDTITLTATDGHQAFPAFPAAPGFSPGALRYSANLEPNCHAHMWVQPGKFRIALVHAGRALVVRDVEIVGAQTIELAVDAERTLSGVLRDANRSPLAGWTIVAHELGGRARYAARTSVDGQFAINGVMAKAVEILATVPEYELAVPVAESVAAPASGLELTVALFGVDLHTMRRDDGADLGSRVRVMPLNGAIANGAERSTDDDGKLHLELPIGEWRLVAMNPDHDCTGSTVVSVKSGGSLSVSMFLRANRHRTFQVSGTGDADRIRWLTLEGPDTAEGWLTIASLADPKGVDTDLPDGRARFDLTKDGDAVGKPIEVRVSGDGPIVLAW